MNESQMLWGLLFGSVGVGLFFYGRRQGKTVPLWSGIGLMVYSWFMPNTAAVLIVGVVLIAVPYFVRR